MKTSKQQFAQELVAELEAELNTAWNNLGNILKIINQGIKCNKQFLESLDHKIRIQLLGLAKEPNNTKLAELLGITAMHKAVQKSDIRSIKLLIIKERLDTPKKSAERSIKGITLRQEDLLHETNAEKRKRAISVAADSMKSALTSYESLTDQPPQIESLSKQDAFAKTPLYYVAEQANAAEIIKALNDRGIDLTTLAQNAREQLISHAIETGKITEIILTLQKHNVDFKRFLKDLSIPTIDKLLVQATKPENKELLDILPVDIRGKYGKTALHYATKKGNIEAVKGLLTRKADIDAMDYSGKTPLHYAVEKKSFKAIKFLVNKKAKVNVRDSDGNTPLHYAAQNGGINVINFLIGKKADINIEDVNGKTPLHYIADMGDVKLVETCIKSKTFDSQKLQNILTQKINDLESPPYTDIKDIAIIKNIVEAMSSQGRAVRARDIKNMGEKFPDAQDLKSSPNMEVADLIAKLSANFKAYDPRMIEAFSDEAKKEKRMRDVVIDDDDSRAKQYSSFKQKVGDLGIVVLFRKLISKVVDFLSNKQTSDTKKEDSRQVNAATTNISKTKSVSRVKSMRSSLSNTCNTYIAPRLKEGPRAIFVNAKPHTKEDQSRSK